MKIEAKDVRFGNIVNSPHGYIAITEISPSSVRGNLATAPHSGNMTFGYDEIKSIPFSSEMLQVFGFTLCDGEKDFYWSECLPVNMELKWNGEYAGTKVMTRLIKPSDVVPFRYVVSEKCRDVHQMQNLIHALTGTDLTITLP